MPLDFLPNMYWAKNVFTIKSKSKTPSSILMASSGGVYMFCTLGVQIVCGTSITNMEPRDSVIK